MAKLAEIHEPETYPVDDSMIIKPLPEEEAQNVEIVRGPNIQPLPVPEPFTDHLCVDQLKDRGQYHHR